MRFTAEALLPAGATMTTTEIAALEAWISAEVARRMQAFFREDQRKAEAVMLHGDSSISRPVGILGTVRAC